MSYKIKLNDYAKRGFKWKNGKRLHCREEIKEIDRYNSYEDFRAKLNKKDGRIFVNFINYDF